MLLLYSDQELKTPRYENQFLFQKGNSCKTLFFKNDNSFVLGLFNSNKSTRVFFFFLG